MPRIPLIQSRIYQVLCNKDKLFWLFYFSFLLSPIIPSSCSHLYPHTVICHSPHTICTFSQSAGTPIPVSILCIFCCICIWQWVCCLVVRVQIHCHNISCNACILWDCAPVPCCCFVLWSLCWLPVSMLLASNIVVVTATRMLMGRGCSACSWYLFSFSFSGDVPFCLGMTCCWRW